MQTVDVVWKMATSYVVMFRESDAPLGSGVLRLQETCRLILVKERRGGNCVITKGISQNLTNGGVGRGNCGRACQPPHPHLTGVARPPRHF